MPQTFDNLPQNLVGLQKWYLLIDQKALIFFHMQIKSNKVVALAYNLSLPDEDGEIDVVEVVSDKDPMYFIFGQSGLPEGFERQLEGLSAGDNFNFQVDPEEGYGTYDPDAIVSLPKSLFQVDGKDNPDLLKVGNVIPMTNEEGHRRFFRMLL